MQYVKNYQTAFPSEVRSSILSGSRVNLPPRQRLIDRLTDETKRCGGLQRLTVCVSPTGYGKTRTIAQWLGDGSDKSARVRWVHCAPESASLLWNTIAHELAALSDQRPLQTDSPQNEAMRFAQALKKSATLILEDYHFATTPDNDIALSQLTSKSTRLTLVVIGRSVGLLDTTLISARTRVRLIDETDLAWPADETKALVASLGIPFNDRLNKAIKNAEGWPLAIHAVLTLGSDVLYDKSPASESNPATLHTQTSFDPLMNLNTFAANFLEFTSAQAQQVIFATVQLDAISLNQLSEVLELDPAATSIAVRELLELGLLIATQTVDGTEYCCHRAVRSAAKKLAAEAVSPEQRARLLSGRAVRIAASAPFTAFKFYCAAEDYFAAEVVLAHNFTTLTDEVKACRQVLRSIPEHAQQLHPTFTAALLFLDTPHPSVAPSTLTHITNLWLESLKKRLAGQGPSESDPIYLALLGQAMVATRVTGQLEASVKLMENFERRFAWQPEETVAPDPDENFIMLTKSPLNGSLPNLFREAAATALAAGDIAHARRLIHQLQKHSEERISAPVQSFGHASTRTVTDRQSGTRWFLAALSELAFVELVHGDMRRCAELISEIDATTTKSGETAPGISWVGAEIARAHLSFEHFDPSLFEHASSKLAPIRERFEQWPLLLMAEAALLRNERGAESALAHLRSGISAANEAAHEPNRWLEFLTKFHVMLCTTSGDLSQAERLLTASTNNTPIIRLERARLSLFSGDDVGALLMSRAIGDPETTFRQQLEQRLTVAVAAWGCGRQDEAFAALADANEYLRAYGLGSMLQGVPYDSLREVAVAARQSGVCDLTELIDAIPKPGRCVRYEQLTDGEVQALTAISEHRNTVQAAASLFVTPGTVKKHLAAVYRKLGVGGRDEAILVASRMGIMKQFNTQ